MAAATVEFVEAAGKEASERRLRLHQVVDFAADYWTNCTRRLHGFAVGCDAELASAVGARLARPQEAEAIEAATERTLEAAEQIDRNANPTTLIECWADDLARILDRRGWQSLHTN